MWLNKTFTNSVTSFNVYNEQRNDRENNMGEGIAVYIKEHQWRQYVCVGPGARKKYGPPQSDDICRGVRGDSPPEII